MYINPIIQFNTQSIHDRPSRFPRAWSLLVASVALMSSAVFGAPDGGWAGYNYNLTGGGTATPVTVTTAAALITQAQTPNTPKVIKISGTIVLSGQLLVESNKTLMAASSGAKIDGDVVVNAGKSNVIFRNLTFTNDRHVGNGDGIAINGGTRVWVDKCTIFNTDDGGIDITNGSDYVTVSWCKFYYTRGDNVTVINRPILIGSNNTDSGNYRITLHHNWFGDRCHRRMPWARFGSLHMYNNYVNPLTTNHSWATNIGLPNSGITSNTQLLSENNHYQSTKNPIQKDLSQGVKIRTVGNKYELCTGTIDDGNDTVFTLPYTRTLDLVADVKSKVTNATTGAGAH